MTQPSSGSPPHRVDDPVAARLLMDAASREVFGCFLDRDRSVREAADLLERDLDAVLYRVKRLLAAGLLEVVAVQRRAGRPVRRYRAPHPHWFVPFEALPYADLEETFAAMGRAQVERAARASARWLARDPWAGYVIGTGTDGQVWLRGTREAPTAGTTVQPDPSQLAHHDGPFDVALDLRLTQAQTAALSAELWALAMKYAELGAVPRGGGANRVLFVLSSPLEEVDRP
ncbi:MAG: hypothetical protein ABR510_09415 [Trueperaceae bacterium]